MVSIEIGTGLVETKDGHTGLQPIHFPYRKLVVIFSRHEQSGEGNLVFVDVGAPVVTRVDRRVGGAVEQPQGVSPGLCDHSVCAGRTLAEFEYRFNRRFDLAAMIPRLGYVAARTPPMPYRLVKIAEDHT